MGTPTTLRKERSVLTGTSFANNTTGAITALMVRQFVESGMGGYATICAKKKKVIFYHHGCLIYEGSFYENKTLILHLFTTLCCNKMEFYV